MTYATKIASLREYTDLLLARECAGRAVMLDHADRMAIDDR
jgi:hypothetical protein